MRTKAEIKTDAKALFSEIALQLDKIGPGGSFGEISTLCVLDAFPLLKARYEALQKEAEEFEKQHPGEKV